MATPTTTRDPAELPDRVTMPLLALVTREAVDEDYVARRPAAGRRAVRRGRPRTAHRCGGGGGDGAVRAADRARGRADRAQRRRPGGQPRRADQPDRRASAGGGLPAGADRLAAPAERRAAVDQLAGPGPARRGDGAAAQPPDQHRLRGRAAAPGCGSPSPTTRTAAPTAGCAPPTCGSWSTDCGGPAPRRSRSTAAGSPRISAIVNSNISVQVNRSPLTPPYVISAIGDDTMAESAAGQHVRRGVPGAGRPVRVRGRPAE